jgi:hypothetical protein
LAKHLELYESRPHNRGDGPQHCFSLPGIEMAPLSTPKHNDGKSFEETIYNLLELRGVQNLVREKQLAQRRPISTLKL